MAGFSSIQSAEQLLMSVTEELSLTKLRVPLTFHLAPTIHLLAGCGETHSKHFGVLIDHGP